MTSVTGAGLLVPLLLVSTAADLGLALLVLRTARTHKEERGFSALTISVVPLFFTNAGFHQIPFTWLASPWERLAQTESLATVAELLHFAQLYSRRMKVEAGMEAEALGHGRFD